MNSKNRLYQDDEESLVSMASQGDLEAYNQLVLRYQTLVYHHAYAMLGDPSLAEDAAQEGFIKAFQGLNMFRGGSFRAWLLRIVTNTCYDFMRRSKTHLIQPLIPEDEHGDEVESPFWLADSSASVQESIEKKEEMDSLYRLLDELPEIYRTAITLIDLNELDYNEAARVLKVPVGTIKSRVARARLQIKDKLQQGGEHLAKNLPISKASLIGANALC